MGGNGARWSRRRKHAQLVKSPRASSFRVTFSRNGTYVMLTCVASLYNGSTVRCAKRSNPHWPPVTVLPLLPRPSYLPHGLFEEHK